MFSIFRKPTKITVDCFTSSEFAYQHTPILKASKHLPSWWKTLPVKKHQYRDFNSAGSESNMRNCAGFTELFNRGAIIPTWADLKFKVGLTEGIAWKASNSNITRHESHPPSQWNNAFPEYSHIKLNPPWAFREKTGIKFHFSEATWLMDTHPITILPGIIEYKLNHATGINVFMRKGDYELFIPAGTPMVHVVPLVEDKIVEFKNHLVSQEEFNRLFFSGPLALFSGYRGMRQLDKKNLEKDVCPWSASAEH